MSVTGFQAGVFNTYRAVNKIHVGQIALDLPEGEVVQFDGTVMKWGGKEHSVPALAAAIRAGWLVVSSDTESKYVPKSGGVKVHAPNVQGEKQGEEISFGSAVEDETVVGNLLDIRERNKKALEKSIGRVTKAPVVEDAMGIENAQAVVSVPPQMSIEHLDVTVGSGRADVTVSMPDKPVFKRSAGAMEIEQEPVVVKTIKSSSSDKNVKAATEDEGVPIAKIKTAAKQRTVLTDVRDADNTIRNLDNHRPPAPIKIATPAEQDIKAVHPSGATGDVAHAIAGDSLEELLPDAASSGIPVLADNFEWDMKLHWKKRVQIAIEKFGNDPEAIKKICAKEMPQVAKHIQAKLAK